MALKGILKHTIMDVPSEANVETVSPTEPRGLFTGLQFRYPFRKYQRLILAQVESGSGDRKYHIVAPPGSGKTIVGLELIRRFGAPAVVFVPTTTIQQQWREKLGMFTATSDDAGPLTSLDPGRLAPISIFTYQLISTPGQAQEYAREMSIRSWVDDLLREGQVTGEDAAKRRIEAIRENNRREYDREMSRRYLALKRRLLRQDSGDVASFLHPNARRLIDRLVGHGVGTIVLDECHHLLDYWAIVLRYLAQQLPGVRIVGLTATLPDPENEQEYENYHSLVGDVDFEVPTPAVVKEGDLAPYRDLVYFVQPTEPEIAYLRDIQAAFEAAVAHITSTSAFKGWVAGFVPLLAGGESEQSRYTAWAGFLNEQPLLSLAVLRYLRRTGRAVPLDLPVPQEAGEEMSLDDWPVLLERYALDVLKVSPDTEHHRQLSELRRTLLPFGLTVTERGLRQGRSAGDLVLALSEAKDTAVAHILTAEHDALGDRLRAVVVTDFETMSSGVKRGLEGVLEKDAGSARGVFRELVADERTSALRPALVTGRALMVGEGWAEEMVTFINGYLYAQGVSTGCSTRPAPIPGAVEIVGEGGEWTSRTYVGAITAAFEAGHTRCLVGTRGIFGEGWDSLTLNTLVDLTAVTTSTTVQQLRGRSIRLDPAWPRKVAHNWDVVCVATGFEKGDSDLKRFSQRHNRYWGVVPGSAMKPGFTEAAVDLNVGGMLDAAAARLQPDLAGAIVKGAGHVDPNLAWDLAVKPFRNVDYNRYTQEMLRRVEQRERSYDEWRIGEEYSNFAYTTTRLQAGDLKIRTVFTLQNTLKRMLLEFRASLLFWFLFGLWLGFRPLIQGMVTAGDGPGLGGFVAGAGILLPVAAVLALVVNARSAYLLGRALLVEQPPDAILLDVGRALFMSLREAELVSKHLQPEYVRVVEQPDNSYRVLLDYASPEDATVFVTAYRQAFAPVRDQRYLILRDDSRLPGLGLTPFWLLARAFVGARTGYKPAYHPVPDLLATRKELAETYARHWSRYVGGRQLVFTRSEQGRLILLQARAQSRPKVESLAFEVWR